VVTDQRTAVDWAHQIRNLVDVIHPHAKRITLVMDNLKYPHRRKEVAARQDQRNAIARPMQWRFTNEDARVKLKKLYPTEQK